jgi:hypothetical protein
MPEYILKQKPYGEIFDSLFLTAYGVVFCPFMHSPPGSGPEYMLYANNTATLNEYHVNKGYPDTSLQNIERCMRYFNNVTEHDIIYVPHNSYDDTADKTLAYKLRIVAPSLHETINGFSALFRKAEIIDDKSKLYADGRPVNRGPSMVKKGK